MADTEFRGLVVGYDGSAHSEAAVDWAAMEAGRRGTGLTVLFAADSPGLPAGPALPIPDLLEWAREVAQGGAVRARKAEVDVEIVARSGSPARALVEASMTAELVVTGSRGHGGLAGALLGSVAFSVTAHAHCPAVVVRGDESTLAGPGPPGRGRNRRVPRLTGGVAFRRGCGGPFRGHAHCCHRLAQQHSRQLGRRLPVGDRPLRPAGTGGTPSGGAGRSHCGYCRPKRPSAGGGREPSGQRTARPGTRQCLGRRQPAGRGGSRPRWLHQSAAGIGQPYSHPQCRLPGRRYPQLRGRGHY